MTKITLGVHLGFAVNRYPEPEEWARLLSEELGVNHVQFCSDMLQPHFPDELIRDEVSKIIESCKHYDIEIKHTFTSQRWAYCGHPSEKVRKYWLEWLKRFAEISGELGAVSTGSRLGIYSVKDFLHRRDLIFDEVIKNWCVLAEHSKNAGLKMLTFEHMSIPREFADTIEEAMRILKIFGSRNPKIPILLCLDTDQGNAFSGNSRDGDPYEWIRVLGKQSPVLHLKQRIRGSMASGKPFTSEYNQNGTIFPEKIVEAIENSGAKEMSLYLEPSFRERLPHDNSVVSDIKQSIEFWRPYVDG